MSATPILRPVGSFDAQVLAALHTLCFTQPWDQPWTEKSFGDVLSMPGTGGWLSIIGDEPVGFAIARIAADEAELLLLGTHPTRRRAGHGCALLAHALRALATAGAMRIYLEVAEPNVAARAFYRGAGFTEVGRRPRYYRAQHQGKFPPAAADAADAIVLSRALVVDPGSTQ